ncbi:MAG TPA: MFS transporter [Streptosporangiaceae bacterium]|nr:MFS transporter [Streptosporangiaceae bacterium]
MRQTLHSGRQVLRRRAFRRFWLGMLISRAGDAFTLVALSWVVLGIAGPAQLGVVLMCFGLPRIVSGPVAGRLLDGSRPRLLLAADNAARGLLIAAVPVLLWQHRLAVADLYGIAAASALLSAATEVAESSLVPRLVADDELDAANSLLSANWELAGIAGPAVAGLILATVGAPLALLLDAGSFAVMTAVCLSLPPLHRKASPEPAGPEPAEPARARDRRGLGILFRFPAVLVLTACGFGMLFLDGLATVLYPQYCRTFLHAGPTGYGVLVSAAGAGALLGVLAGPGLSGRLPPSPRLAAVIGAGAALFGSLALAPGLVVAAVLLGLATFAWGPYYVFERTLMQRLVPDQVRSRVAGARMTLSSLGFPLGSAAGGTVTGGIGVTGTVLVVAGSGLALGLLPLLAPALRELGRARAIAGLSRT